MKKDRRFLIQDIDCETLVEVVSRKEVLSWLDEYLENLSNEWFDAFDDTFAILYKDGSYDYINQDYNGHKIKKQNIASIVYTVRRHFKFKISLWKQQFIQRAVKNGTLFSCIGQEMQYDGICSRGHKKKRTPPTKVWFPSHPSAGSPGGPAIPMIRPFTIFCRLNQISFSDRQWFGQEAGSLSHTDGVCPVCHAEACLSPFASYTRCLVERKEELPATHGVTVQRYRCSSCGHTHALLPGTLVPYSSYPLRFILKVLRDYFLHRACVQKICEHAGISVSALCRFKALFLAHKALWLGLLEDLEASAEAFLDGMDGTLLRGFCRKFLFSFLQRLRGTSPDPPSGTPGQPSGFT